MARLVVYNSPEEAGIEPRKLSAVLIRGPHLSIVVTVEEDDLRQQPTNPERGSADLPEEER